MTFGPLVGGVTDTTANVWARTDVPASVSVEYSTDAALTSSTVSGVVQTSSTHDFTAIVPIAGLQPLTRYYYRILVNGVPQESGNYPTFVTFPPVGPATDFAFGVLADEANPAQNPTRDAPAFAALEANDPAFVAHLGDFNYNNPTNLAAIRKGFQQDISRQYTESGEFLNEIAHNFPFDFVYDDHDSGPNNGDKTFPNRWASIQAYQEYYPTYPLADPAHGIQHSFTYGNSEFFMLDLRSERSPNFQPDNAGKSLTGDAQLQWLEQGLLNSTSTWKFIMSSVALNQTSRSDGWNQATAEWHQLTDFILQNHISGVIAVSGDLHSLGAIDNRTNSGIPEVSVPYTNLTTGRADNVIGTWSQGAFVGNNSGGYTLVRVLTGPDEVVLENHAPDGTLRQSYTVVPEAFTLPATHLGVSVPKNSAQGQPFAVAVTAWTRTTGGRPAIWARCISGAVTPTTHCRLITPSRPRTTASTSSRSTCPPAVRTPSP
jgi:alkaline phosphatase D